MKKNNPATIPAPAFAGREMSQYFNPRNPVFLSTKMTGKMEGVPAISTACTCNPLCQARINNGGPGCVCPHCYADLALKNGMRKTTRMHAEDNFHVLNARDLLPFELPRVCADVCRLEAFGDLASVTHARNFLRIARENPWCLFVLWTKNPAFMDQALKELGRPENIKFIYSSAYLNKPEKDICARFPWFDHCFTVWTAAGAEEAGIEINCGGRRCRECMRCYTRGTEFEINELLK